MPLREWSIVLLGEVVEHLLKRALVDGHIEAIQGKGLTSEGQT